MENRRSLVIITAFVLAFLGSTSHAADCPGDTRQEHHVTNYNFVTSSWVEEVGSRRRYVSCVANLDRGSDLLITWFIPGPFDQYVPDDEVSLSPRLRDDLNPRPVDGCLKYGSLGEKRTAEFLGTAEDESANARESNCGQKLNNIGEPRIDPQGLPPDGWSDTVRIFFPSNLSDPRNTMLKLEGVIGISVKGDSYMSYFDYTVERYKDRPDGIIEDVRFEPVFTGQTEQFLGAFAVTNKEQVVPLSPKGSVYFEVAGSAEHKWSAIEAYYRFFDKDNRTLAAIHMPLFRDIGE